MVAGGSEEQEGTRESTSENKLEADAKGSARDRDSFSLHVYYCGQSAQEKDDYGYVCGSRVKKKRRMADDKRFQANAGQVQRRQ
jgi:hypothetical protein